MFRLNELAVAVAVGVDNGALSRIIEWHWQKGLIVREIDLWNRRAVRLRLNEAGNSLVPVPATEADRNDEAFFGVIGAEERRQFPKTAQRKWCQFNYPMENKGNGVSSIIPQRKWCQFNYPMENELTPFSLTPFSPAR